MKDISILTERQIYAEIRANYGDFPTTEGFLRQDIKIENQKGTYAFDFLPGGGTQEQRLSRNDLFFATHVSMHLIQSTIGKEGSAILQSYPNPIAFVDNAVIPDLEIFYCGKMVYSVNNSKNHESIDLHSFREVPRTVRSATVTHSSYDKDSGKIRLIPFGVLNGGLKNELKVEPNLYSGLSLEPATGTIENKLVVKMHGFLVAGAANTHRDRIEARKG